MKYWFWGLVVLLISPFTEAEWNETPDYWKCYHRVSGSWIFGVAPYGCDASAFGDNSKIIDNYSPVLFNETDSSSQNSSERYRYMQETYSMIKAAAAYYIQSRRADVSQSEINAFQHAALAVAHQESFWSHYRIARQDGRYKMMRGDFGHGHGLMQVDDRAHYTATKNGKGWELIANIIYSLDEYYQAWRYASSKWCVQQYGASWRNIAREAYSQYNGGPSASCRWTNPNHRWSRNDKGFAQKYDTKSWESYVADTNQPSKINVSCLANGGSHCPPNNNTDTSNWYHKLLQTVDNMACVYDGMQLHCMKDMRHSGCLVSVGNYDSSSVLHLSQSDTSGIQVHTYDPHTLCFDNVPGLAPVGSFIKLVKAINLRLTPNGELIHQIPANTILQVEDIAVFNNQTLNRFYQVTHQGQTGYIWGGTQADYREWYQTSTEKPAQYPVPVHGDWVQIKIPGALNLRATPAGEKIGALQNSTKVLVKGIVTKDETNKIYLHIEHQGQEGYIYSGRLLPAPGLTDWTVMTSPADDSKAAYCPQGASYDGARMVCRNKQHVFGPFSNSMTERCRAWGGGDACENKFEVVIDGVESQLTRWSADWFETIRGNSQCPKGTSRNKDYFWHCVEKNAQGEITDVYGPFGSELVNKCLLGGGGKACYYNRWSASGFLYWSRLQ